MAPSDASSWAASVAAAQATHDRNQILMNIACTLVGLGIWSAVCQLIRFRRLKRLQRLSPEADAHEVVSSIAMLEIPYIYMSALEFGLFRTYAIPSVSKLLSSTGELTTRCLRRYDDTSLLIREFTENHLESKRGSAAIRRMNYLHSRYRISNDDMLYTLTVFVCEPIRWAARWAWRPLCSVERVALFNYWRAVGVRMGIDDIPSSVDDMMAWNEAYEAKKMVAAPSNRKVAEGTIALFLSPFPALLRPLLRPVLVALMDDRLREAMSLAKPPKLLRWLAPRLLVARAKFVRWMMPERPSWLSARRTALTPDSNGFLVPLYHMYGEVYPHGYKIEDLGPPDVAGDGKLGDLCPGAIKVGPPKRHRRE